MTPAHTQRTHAPDLTEQIYCYVLGEGGGGSLVDPINFPLSELKKKSEATIE